MPRVMAKQTTRELDQRLHFLGSGFRVFWCECCAAVTTLLHEVALGIYLGL